MSSRYAPPPRDRSPPRYDRRPSAAYPATGSSYRGTADSAQPPLDRPPPRGPKAESFRGNFPYTPPPPRGRGTGTFPARPTDAWDRDRERERERERDRDVRPPSQSYRTREDDRPEWSRRERDFTISDRAPAPTRDSRPYVGRERSASPVRPRRDSRDSIPSTFSRPTDSATSYYSPATRGGLGRGRGRGDWDRTRGRNSFGGDRERDRDLFAPRSRSRDGWRDRDFDRARPGATDADRYDRREFEPNKERDIRARDHDVWQRDPSPSKNSVGQSGGRAATPTGQASTTGSHFTTLDRDSKTETEVGRRQSAGIIPSATSRESRRDIETQDHFGSRLETPRREGNQPSYQVSTAPPPAAAGLDYGPPPSIPSGSTPTVEKAAPSKPQPPKTATSSTSSVPFQPPSGPKADRTTTGHVGGQAPKTPQQHDGWSKSDVPTRPSRPLSGPGSSTLVPDNVIRNADLKAEVRSVPTSIPDKSMPANVPSGPRSAMGPAFKAKLPSTESPSIIVPPSAPRDALKPSIDNRPAAIPTGPRLDRDSSWNTTGNVSKSWISPEYRTKPSIMNPLNRDRPSFAPTAPRQQSIFQSNADKPRIFQPSGSSASRLLPDNSSKKLTDDPISPGKVRVEPGGPGEDVDMSLPVSSEDDVDEDEFDEDDFAASEEKYLHEKRLLEAKKPPPLLQDNSIRALLIRIQFLNMIFHDVIPKPADVSEILREKTKDTSVTQIGLPSPEQLSEDQDEKPEPEELQPQGRPLHEPPINPIPTPPIEDLPYLSKEPLMRAVFEDSDDEVQHEAVTMLIRQEFEQAAFEWRDDLDMMKYEFKRRYPSWKQDVTMLENERRELLQPSPAPASPAPSAAASVTPSLGHERTRGARNTTEADLQAAILMSQQSLKEEEERREREAASSSLPNYDTEAVVPAMLKPTDMEWCEFDDTNRLISPDIALDTFAYLPPEDDFTEDEQLAFISAYCQNPKKWGKIADALPRRTYQECITHYYLTKNAANYKEIFRRSQPKRKRGRAATKPRSTALMSELVYGEEGDPTAVAVTDTGRPRRAAAPTFGDATVDSDISTPIPQSKRLALGVKDGSVEPTAHKSGRGRKPGAVSKPRRTKAQIQADQQAAAALLPVNSADPALQKPAMSIPRAEKARAILRAEHGQPTDIVASAEPMRIVENEMPQYIHSEQPPLTSTNHIIAAPQMVTSYWSVPEQQKFPHLIAYYGRDFASIAEFMKTKSVIMIKNYYTRQVNDGKVELEKLAKVAEQRRANGEAMGTPPSPAAQAKRKYEATPSTTSYQRSTALPSEYIPADAEHHPTIKSIYTEDFPSNAVHRSATGDLIAKPRQMREIIREAPNVSHNQHKAEDVQNKERNTAQVQRSLQGPRSGFFKEENTGYHSPHQPMHVPLHERSPLQPQQRSLDIRSGDVAQHMPARSPPQVNVGPPRETVSNLQHQPQAVTIQTQPPDRYGQFSTYRPSHSRDTSLGVSHATLEQAQDLASLRRVDSHPRHTTFGVGAAQSPKPVPVQTVLASRRDLPQSPTSASSQVELPKPAPAKRSNIMSILNDDPPEPPASKHSSFEAQKRSSILSPQPAPVPVHSTSHDQSRNQLRQEDMTNLLNRGVRNTYGLTGNSMITQPPSRDHPSGFSSSPAPMQPEVWLDRFDPRQQAMSNDQRPLHQSPALSHYSVVPPSSQPGGLSGVQSLRMESQRSMESNPDHRRSLLVQMNQSRHNPSPPPAQPSQQPVPPYRSSSSSSHHARVSSIGYQQSQTPGHAHQQPQQPPPQQHQQAPQAQPHLQHLQHHQSQVPAQPPAPSSHPQSTSSTPVSGLHHRSQPSIDYHPRLTIQQHMREQEQAQAIQRQRDIDDRSRISHRDHDPLRSHQDPHARMSRDRYGNPSQDHLLQQQQQQQPPQSQTFTSTLGGSRHIPPTYNHNHQSEPPRTYTPPYGAVPTARDNREHVSHHHHHHSHSHSHSHSQTPQPLTVPPPPPQSQSQQQTSLQPQPHLHHRGAGMHYRGPSQDERR